MSQYLLPVEPMDSLPSMPWSDKLAYLTWKFLKLEQADCPLQHSFENDQYIRRIAIPKNTLFIGRIHKVGHQVDLLTGTVIHVRESCRRIVSAPFTLHTKPGDQVCALALTDIAARTVHPADGCRNIEALEEKYFGTTQSLKDQGEQVHQRLTQRLYHECHSSSGRSSSSSGGRRYVCGIL